MLPAEVLKPGSCKKQWRKREIPFSIFNNPPPQPPKKKGSFQLSPRSNKENTPPSYKSMTLCFSSINFTFCFNGVNFQNPNTAKNIMYGCISNLQTNKIQQKSFQLYCHITTTEHKSTVYFLQSYFDNLIYFLFHQSFFLFKSFRQYIYNLILLLSFIVGL